MDKDRTKVNDYSEIPDGSLADTVQPIKKEQMDRKDFLVLNGMLWECFGTMALSFGALNCLGNPFSVAIIIGIAVALTVQQSGAHFNPAVSLNFYLEKHLSLKGLLSYAVMQFIGATLGVLLYTVLDETFDGPDVTVEGLNPVSYFFSEFIGTFFLVFVINLQIHHETELTKDLFLIITDFVFAVLASRELAYSSGGSLNPSVATSIFFTSRIINGYWKGVNYIWFLILGPFCGCAFSNLFYHKIFLAYFNKLNVEVIKKRSIDLENEKLADQVKVEEYDSK